MSDDIAALRQEVRQQFTQLTAATNEIASSVSKMTALVARIEERNVSHDDGMRRLGKLLDDHEERIRIVERNALTQTSYVAGTWKVVTIVAAIVSVVVGATARFFPL
ncbi:hypothetical protein DN730_08075 [Marinomonas piezotolerans]|uniref:DUF1515 domain-containing protein n=1 Tax=Marinomonas piezotolerans TaxID=2213058 RepID=A0A370U9A9_9GAMM|nr:hypothetical protein [Marinomonas piezotolerans]RDL44351.1 hypothetical protein DN730_08075 [Marinomonas piezotolerans]